MTESGSSLLPDARSRILLLIASHRVGRRARAAIWKTTCARSTSSRVQSRVQTPAGCPVRRCVQLSSFSYAVSTRDLLVGGPAAVSAITFSPRLAALYGLLPWLGPPQGKAPMRSAKTVRLLARAMSGADVASNRCSYTSKGRGSRHGGVATAPRAAFGDPRPPARPLRGSGPRFLCVRRRRRERRLGPSRGGALRQRGPLGHREAPSAAPSL